MFRRLWWISASYFTRPLIQVIVWLGLFFSLAAWADKTWNTRYDSNYPYAPRPRLMVDSAADLEQVRTQGRQDEVDAINFNYLWADVLRQKQELRPPAATPTEWSEFRTPDEVIYRVLEEFPNVHIVHVTLWEGLAGAARIAKLPNLEYLFIDGPLRGADLSWPQSAGKLRWLELSLYQPPTGLDALAELPSLEIVVFRSRNEVTDDVL